jgi:predicted ATPase
VIEFYSPLTVIVGHNGSGKTVSGSDAAVSHEGNDRSHRSPIRLDNHRMPQVRNDR